jgi:hypothetical protein
MDPSQLEMDAALLEKWEECDRMQHANRKTFFLPPPLTSEERATLTGAQLLVRRGVHGLYIDACETEDTLERTYADTFPLGVEWDYGVLNPEIATLQRLCKSRRDDLRWAISETEKNAIEREILWLQNRIAETWQTHIESAPTGDKVRMIIPQKSEKKSETKSETKSEDEEETLVDDTEEQEPEIGPVHLEHPWWLEFCDPEQERLTETQATWLFRFLFVNFVSLGILVHGTKRFLLSSAICLIPFWLWSLLSGKQIDIEVLRKINPKLCLEYVRSVCRGLF